MHESMHESDEVEYLGNNFLKGFSSYLAYRYCYSLLNHLRCLSFYAMGDSLILILHFHRPVRKSLFPYLMVWLPL